MKPTVEQRFDRYCEEMVGVLGHADRHEPGRMYLKGLLLPGQRKSVEPMAARVAPDNVRRAHQSMHHLVADSEWSDEALLGAAAQAVLPELCRGGGALYWIADDTGFPKQGRHSVGVARQYCGQLGKTDNCQVAVSLSLANARGSLPLGFGLYLPQEWTDDRRRCRDAGVPEEVAFATKGDLALGQIEAALAAGVKQGTVLADAAYGDEAEFRDRLSELGLRYAVGVRKGTCVWWGEHQPGPVPTSGRGRPRTRLVRDRAHQPISLIDLAREISPRSFRQISWREGVKGRLSSRFARLRVRAAHGNRARTEEWLLIEWPAGESEPTRYWLSTLPPSTSFRTLVDSTKARWRIERDYQDLKQELGLSHYEGRNWRGFHHHASLCIAAYGFLMLERLRYGGKKNRVRLPQPALPRSFRPRGAGPDAASRSALDRHRALSAGTRDRKTLAAVPLLRTGRRNIREELLTQ